MNKDSIIFLPLPSHKLFQNLTGLQKGHLTVLGLATSVYPYRWWCECDCGTVYHVAAGHLQKPHGIRSCNNPIHKGTHHKRNKPEYKIWDAIKGRCYRVTDVGYHNYGGRGIKVCERWKNSFENFFADMGERPSSEHSIERKNNDGDYEPTNCEWVDRLTQANNKRTCHFITLYGETLSVAAWCRRFNIAPSCVRSRLLRGQDPETALTVPSNRIRPRFIA